MIDLKQDIQSLTTFRRNSAQMMKQLKKSKWPVVLTVKGKDAAVLQDAGADQRLADIAAEIDVHEASRQGLEDVANNRTNPAQDGFDEIRRQFSFLR